MWWRGRWEVLVKEAGHGGLVGGGGVSGGEGDGVPGAGGLFIEGLDCGEVGWGECGRSAAGDEELWGGEGRERGGDLEVLVEEEANGDEVGGVGGEGGCGGVGIGVLEDDG